MSMMSQLLGRLVDTAGEWEEAERSLPRSTQRHPGLLREGERKIPRLKKIFLHLYFLTQWFVSVWWLWTPSHRVRPPVVRVPSRRLADPLGSSCGHECQDAGRGLQDRLALQVSGPDGELDVRQADLSCAYAVCVRTHAGGSCRSPRRLTCRIPGTNTNRWRSAATDRWARHVYVTLLVWVVVDIRFVKCMNLTWWGVDSSPVRRVVEQCHHS